MEQEIQFKEGIDYVFIRQRGEDHFDYIIRIRIAQQDEENPYLLWELGVLNPLIAVNKSSVNAVAYEYVSMHGYDDARIEVDLIDYTPKK